VPRLDHIIVIIMENKAYDKVRFAPYTAGLIGRSSSMAHSYAYQHQSQSDYYAMWSAVGRGVTESICPAVGSPYYTENLGHLCEANGRTWKAYSEDLPAAGDTICQKRNYVRRHCPWTDWGNLNHMNERPYGDLAGDILNGTLPNLAYVVPNLCNDAHNYCGVDTIQIADDWLSANMPVMIQGVGPHGVVILTWDEDDGSDGNHILTVFAGQAAKPGYVSQRYMNFFAMMRTITDGLGLPAFAEAVSASPVTDVWAKNTVLPPPPPPPVNTVLSPVKPNPSRGYMSTTIDLSSTTDVVHADVYDASGRHVRHLLQGPFTGLVTIGWDGKDDNGRRVASGLYLLKVRTSSTQHEAKLLLLK
jgi:phosphatidylinositol-3-phosphatase